MPPIIFRQGSGRVVSSVLRFSTGTLTQAAGEAVYTPPGGGGGGGAWTSSGYTGTASRFAVFDSSGSAAYLSYPSVGLVAWTGSVWAATTIDSPLSLSGGHLSVDLSAYLTTAAAAAAYQPLDADLTALAGLGDGLPYRSGGVWGATALGDLSISGGSVQVTQARGLRESGGTTLTMGAVADGEVLRRSSTSIVGAAIGSVLQAYSAILTAISALSSSGLIARTGAGTVAARTLTAGTGVTISNGDGASGNPTISMTGGSNTDRDATYAYTVDWYVQKSSILADNATLTQTGTTAMTFDNLRHRPALRSTAGAIYTTNLDTMIWGSDFTASAVILTNPTALTGNVYKFGLTTSNTMTTALADAVQQFSIVYRQASGGNWRIITRNASTTTDTDSGVTVVAGTWYRFEIVAAAGGTSVDVTIKSGTISTWTSSTTVTVTATLPVSDTFHGMYLYNGTTSGTMALYFYGAHFQQVFRT